MSVLTRIKDTISFDVSSDFTAYDNQPAGYTPIEWPTGNYYTELENRLTLEEAQQ